MQDDRRPILVLDAHSLMGFLPDWESLPIFDNVFGGRAWVCMESLDTLLKELKDCGADLVFFFDARTGKSLDRMKQEMNVKFAKTMNFLRLIQEGEQTAISVQDEENNFGFNFEYNKQMLSMIRGVCEKYGEIHVSLNNGCDREIASFVGKNPLVLGVCADDSDYLIFPGNFKYFSTRSFVCHQKRKTLTIMERQRKKLRNRNVNDESVQLMLNDIQLAVFATFCGNDWMPYDVIRKFHIKMADYAISHGYQFGMMLGIADLVRNNFHMETVNLDEMWMTFHGILLDLAGPDEDLVEIANSEILRKDFDTSISFYLLNDNLKLSKEISPDAINDIMTHQVLNNAKLRNLPVLLDTEDSSIGKIEDLFHARLSRQYGAILKLNTFNREFRLLTYLSNKNECELIEFDAVQPPFDIDNIINGNSSQNERFNLLKWMSSMDFDDNFDINTFPHDYVVDILTMSCMFMSKGITLKELDLILWTIFSYHHRIIPKYLIVPGDHRIQYRAFCIPFIFGQIRREVLHSIEICKLQDVLWVSENFKILKKK